MEIDIHKKFRLIKMTGNDPRKYTSLVVLFDRPDFLADIEKIRNNLEIVENKFFTQEEIDNYLFEDEIDTDLYEEKPDDSLRELVKKVAEFSSLTAEKYKKTKNYETPITYAVLCNLVDTDSLVTAPRYGILAQQTKPQNVPEMVMTFYPETTVKEVMDSFHKMKQTTTDIYFEEYYSGKMPTYDTIKNITRDRNIYWLKKSGMSWSQVGRYVTENFEEVDPRALSKAYERYEAALSI